MFVLKYKTHTYTADQIRSPTPLATSDVLLSSALQFCRQWLGGHTHFKQHTSGSTASPQAILLSRAQMLASAQQTCRFFALQPKDFALVCLNPTYIAGKMMLLRCILADMPARLCHPTTKALSETLRTDEKYTFLSFVPLQLHALFKADLIPKLKQAKAILLGGAPLPDALKHKITQHQLPVYQTFGMTETASHIALRKVGETEYYHCLPEIRIKTNTEKKLCIQGKVTENKWLITNDLVEIISPKKFRWIGRAGRIANSGGVKISLDLVAKTIEAVLNECLPSSPNFAVTTLSDQKLGEKIVLLIEGKPLEHAHLQALKNTIEKKINRYAIPKIIAYTQRLPCTRTLKIDYQEIRNFIQKNTDEKCGKHSSDT